MDEKEFKVVETLTVTFSNTKPVEVIDFLSAVQGFQSQYKNILKENNLKYSDDLKLYIQVRDGSIEWIFSLLGAGAVNFVQDKILRKLYSKTTDTIEKIKKGKQADVDITTLENTQKILRPAKGDLPSNMRIVYKNQEEELEFNIDGVSGRGVFSEIGDIIDRVRMPANKEFSQEVMSLSVSDKNVIKAKIETINSKNLAIICDKDIKDKLIKASKKNPFHTYFVVSGNIKSTDGKIVAYQISSLDDIIETEPD